MILYVVLVFIALCLGMAISVYAFGTGGKRKYIFQNIYYSIEEVNGIGVLYSKKGEYAVILKIENPVQKFSADVESYNDFTRVLSGALQTLGEGYAFHKQDIFVRKQFEDYTSDSNEYLTNAYFRYFRNRNYTENTCYIVITQESKGNRLFSYDSRRWKDFLLKIRKVHDLFRDSKIMVSYLNKQETSDYVDRYFAMNFKDKIFSMSNFKVDSESICMGNQRARIYSLVDVDLCDLPSQLSPYRNIEVNGVEMPVDIMSVIDGIPAETVVYNQIIYMPNQKRELAALEKKKNRHASIPNPSNQLAVEDIRRVQDIIARENRQLVYSHFNLIVSIPVDRDVQTCTNYIENNFSRLGIHISKQAYNQLELFVGSFPGNCYQLNEEYDRFLTLSDGASCLFYKEHMQHSEVSPLKVYYTDRQGVPLSIDITGKEGRNKLTDNSNFFCLGPSGSGKSFHINSVMRQLYEQGTDIVLVDTGNSYEGLCEYVGGKYISYTEEHPITMNPFYIGKHELNIEKIGFLKSLVLLIWKGSQAVVSKTEDRLIELVITEYYDAYFNGFTKFSPEQHENLYQTLLIEDRNEDKDYTVSESVRNRRIEKKIDAMEKRRCSLKVESLSFNTFYEYSVQRMPDICNENNIAGVDISTYSFVMKDFYRGGTYEKTLNEKIDGSLFDESFIVFEIDSIKNNALLFPLVTLIIMDVFLQKMRIKKNRKVLVIEEAWKAIASPLMAEYIKFMYKTARKFWASVGVVTQEIQDIIGSEIVKEAIINNSDVVMLLDQSKFRERFDSIKAILGLTDIECKKIFTINRLDNKNKRGYFREIFIRRGAVSDVFGVEEPHECYMMYTTERTEREAFKLYRDAYGGSLYPALEAYCRDWRNSGIPIDTPIVFAQLVHETGHVLNIKESVTTDE